MERNYESNKFGVLIEPQAIAGTLYNGSAATVASGTGLDTQGYEGITIMLNSGTFTGDGTLNCSAYESETDDSTAASLITGATFDEITTANDRTAFKAYIRVRRQKRYLWLKTVKTGSGDALISASYAMENSKGPEVASADLEFCVDGSV